MKYLLDTDVIINFLRHKIQIDRKIKHADLYISIISLGELVYGAYKSSNTERSLEIVEGFLADLSIGVIDINQEIIYQFGQIKAGLEKKGQRLEDFDLLIAATAKVDSLTLVTRNVNHFKRIQGLNLAQ